MASNPLTTNLSNITTGATAAASLASLVLVIPTSSNPSATKGYQPLNPTQPSGLPSLSPLPKALLFHYEGEQTAMIESDITDHYVENNTSIQDQIALKPEILTTKGYIGELNNVLPSILQPLQTIANTLITIDAYTPQLSATALIAYNQAILLYENAASIAQSAVSAWSSLLGSSGNEIGANSGVFTSGSSIIQNKQQVMFQQFYGYWNSRTLFNVQTPWAIFTNMAIKSLRAIQDAETRMITDFEVTFKKIRTAQTLTSAGGLFGGLSQGRAATQSSGLTDLGTSSGTGGASLGTNIASSLA
jgi:hypothetical protein